MTRCWFVLLIAVLQSSHMLGEEPQQPFPTRGLMPKAEIGALRLLEKHPEYDGRGVVVAVFDTGVDPGAEGLRTTSDGKPKVIDLIDGTGNGDVIMRLPAEKPQGDTVEGLTGRALKLDPAWLRSPRRFRIGMKRGYDFFADALVARLKRERREKFDEAQRRAEDALRLQIADWDDAHPQPSAAERREREELAARLEQLVAAGKSIKDPGPIYDCAVFQQDGEWYAVVDSDEDGDLTDEKPLTNFRRKREFGTLGGGADLNFAVNIYEDGKRLSIVGDSGAHATHVAGIIAGHYPEQPELNGIAPGAQIVSVKIGENRMHSMETGTSIVRGLSAAVANGCDAINMSYGEPTSLANRGRLLDLISQVVNKHGVVFVASAGNSGPGLSTVIAPGGVTDAVLGVGAYVSPQMMAAEYTLREQLPGMPYTWSSRGPALDGDLGVDIMAPGGAFAPVPRWTLNRNMQMNGTSMSSPNACGAVALLISAAKAAEKPYSPYSIRRALQNTAQVVAGTDVFAQGAGLIQVDRAVEHVLAHADDRSEVLRYEVEVSGRETPRGILLREPHEMSAPTTANVHVRPVFHEETPNADQTEFQMRVAIECSQPWVKAGGHIFLASAGRKFELEVDPRALSAGVHYAEVRGYDSADRSRGPLFRLPVTVIKPVELEKNETSLTTKLSFEPGQCSRQFVAVPAQATWADLRLHSLSQDGERRFVIHSGQQRSGQSFNAGAERQYVTLEAGGEAVRSFPVDGGVTMDLCIAQDWSNLGETEIQCEIEFHGLRPDRQSLTLLPGEVSAEVEVAALNDNIELAPRASLNTWRHIITPASAKIRPLTDERDRLVDGSTEYELVLEYRFTQEKSGTATPRFPFNDQMLYESPLGEHFWLLFDGAKRRIAADDVMPGSVKLGKGPHVLRLQLRHSDVSRLEQATGTLLWLDRPLPRKISLSVHPSRVAAAGQGDRFATKALAKGEKSLLHIAAPSAKQWPAGARAGDVLLGTVAFGKANDAQPGAGSRPGGFELRCIAPPRNTKEKPSAPASVEKPSTAERLAKELLNARISQLKQLAEGESELFDKMADEILSVHPHHLEVLVARLHRLDHVSHRKTRLPAVVAAADTVIAQINPKQLALHFGNNIDREDAADVRRRQDFERQRDILVDTLYRKGRALGYMELPDVVEKHPIEDPEALDAAFEANFAELRKWVDTTGEKYFLLHVRRDRRQERFGQALAVLNRHIPSVDPKYWHFKKRRDLYEQLGWRHLWDYEKTWLLTRFPKDYEPF